ncbi:MAG: hypothetical protein ICV84_17215 [Flavisolibacter sp.]|nr:hypothetical protein [Flavisolibacter sp.]
MRDQFDLLVQQLFNKPSLHDCSVEELGHAAEQYPYFAPAQLLYLRKLKGTPEYEQQYQKAILYHHDPLTFDNLLNPEKYYTDFDWEEELLQNEEKTVTVEAPLISDAAVENVEPSLQEPPVTPIEDIPTNPVTDAPEFNLEKNIERTDTPQEEIPEPETVEIQQKGDIQQIKPTETTSGQPNQKVAFEAYHTVDYFASQGIKLSQEEVSSDRFDKQLKSFTEWLKTMKRLPAAERYQQIDAAGEQKVEHMAQHSVKDSDIVTEAMAEVWVKQGNKQKAVDVYHKLSLLNPSKRAYFAAKIEELIN